MPYPSNRPFFANFFAAFRASPYAQKAGPAAGAGAAATQQTSQPQQGLTMAAKSPGQTTSSTAAAVAAHAFQSARSPTGRQHSTSPRPGPRSPGHQSSLQRSRTPSRGRRPSDSSSEGGGLIGAGNWYIGGRTPSGEERFYQLGMVKRCKSTDRLSMDRLSL